jgi:sugar phosphate permease
MTGMGGGAILGSLVLAKMGSVRNKGYWLIATGTLWGLLVALFALSETFITATLFIALIGFISAVNMSMNRSLVQLQVEQHMRGRIMSIDLMSHGLMPLGVLPIGYIAENVSISAGLVTSGIILCLSTLVFGSLMPKVRALNLGY